MTRLFVEKVVWSKSCSIETRRGHWTSQLQCAWLFFACSVFLRTVMLCLPSRALCGLSALCLPPAQVILVVPSSRAHMHMRSSYDTAACFACLTSASRCILPSLTHQHAPIPIHILPDLPIHSSIPSSSLLFTYSHTFLPTFLSPKPPYTHVLIYFPTS